MKKTVTLIILLFHFAIGGKVTADEDIAALSAKGKSLYTQQSSCRLCHGEKAQGGIGPSLQFGPTPFDIHYQLETNPQMGPIKELLKPSNDDLVALAIYIRELSGGKIQASDLTALRSTINSIKTTHRDKDFFLTERDRKIKETESFDTVLKDWRRRAKTGNIMHTYQTKVAATFEPGKPKFKPEPGRVYFYENTGTDTNRFSPTSSKATNTSSQVVVGDAISKEVIAYYQMPQALRGAIHNTVMSPDGKYVYIIGSRPYSKMGSDRKWSLDAPATIIKVDAITLQPVKQIITGNRVHHAQIFQDKYILFDTFSRDDDGLDIFLYDPVTDEIIGGVRDEDLGGTSYTAWTDNKHIFILMQPHGYGSFSTSGYVAAMKMNAGKLTTMRPFWVARLDPKTWEVVREYPYPGYRGDWIVIDSKKEYMYIPAGGSANLSKINLETGAIVWTTPTGIGPYGANLNADETEIWVADKGETTGMFGRTITVIENQSGKHLHTLFSGYQVDHVLLAPNGKEFWATSNGEGSIFVFDAETHEKTKVIPMPNYGDPHGLVWVHYDEHGNPRVVRDQGGFHNGINPAKGKPLIY